MRNNDFTKVIQNVEFKSLCEFLSELVLKITFDELISWLNRYKPIFLTQNNLTGQPFYLLPAKPMNDYCSFINPNTDFIFLQDAEGTTYIVIENKFNEMQLKFSDGKSSIKYFKNPTNGLFEITLKLSITLSNETIEYKLLDKYFQISISHN